MKNKKGEEKKYRPYFEKYNPSEPPQTPGIIWSRRDGTNEEQYCRALIANEENSNVTIKNHAVLVGTQRLSFLNVPTK